MSLFKKKDLTETTAEETDNPSVTATAVPAPFTQGGLRSENVPSTDSDDALAGSEGTDPVPAVVAHDDSVPSAPIVAERPAELALFPSSAPAFDTVDDLTDTQLAAIHARVLHGEIIEM